MKINELTEKTKATIFGMSPKAKEACFMLGHHEVRVEERIEYLVIKE